LCAAVVDQLCRQRQPDAVLDVGTGTGVLARIARARGATFVVGTDIDAGALMAAAANSALDEHAITVSGEAPDFWGARFDLIVANILEEPLRELAPALKRALAEHGVLVISGFTRVQVPGICVCYQGESMRVVRQAQMDEWALLVFERSPQSPGG
jgi:ribosomal protein L11 methyltransferase